MSKPWDLVETINSDIAANPLWAGSSWEQSFRHHQLTYTKWTFWLKNFYAFANSPNGDATQNEMSLAVAIEKQIAEFNATWEF